MAKLYFVGSSQDDLRAFPAFLRQHIGLELWRVQKGDMPTDFKPMPSVGRGVYEIRVRLDGAWRVLFVVRHGEGIFVLHAFQKKTEKTAASDIFLGKQRLRLIEA